MFQGNTQAVPPLVASSLFVISTGLKSGTLYPILMRLKERGWLETRWEVVENGKPPRHMYRLTPDGLELAREEIKLRQSQGARRLSWSGAKA